MDQTAGALVRNRDFGIGGNSGAGEGIPIGSFGNNANYMALNGWYGGAGVNAANHFDGFSPLLTMCRFAGGYIGQIQITNNGKMGIRGGTGATTSNQAHGHRGMRFTALVTRQKPATVHLKQHLLWLVSFSRRRRTSEPISMKMVSHGVDAVLLTRKPRVFN